MHLQVIPESLLKNCAELTFLTSGDDNRRVPGLQKYQIRQ